MREDIERVLLDEAQIHRIVSDLGRRISADYAGKNLLMVSVLKGSVVFMAGLMRAIDIPCRIDFMAVSSYGSGVRTSGVVKIVKDLDINLAGYDLLIVEDILDSGVTLSYLKKMLMDRNPPVLRFVPSLISRNGAGRISSPTMSARVCLTSLLSDTDWIMTKNTGIYHIWAY